MVINMLKCAIIGYGGLGQVHLGNLVKIQEESGRAEVVALCDIDSEKFTKSVDTNLGAAKMQDVSKYRLYTDTDSLLKAETLDFVVIATPTYTHAQIAIKCLDSGLHTFVEKPMAMTAAECAQMMAAADKSGKILQVGQCLRFWPEYVMLKSLIDSEEYGKVVRASFTRLSPMPLWSWDNWLMDFERSGGAALDLHVHDVDTVQWLFGMPKSVSSRATHSRNDFECIDTVYEYDGKLVTAIADWGFNADYSFFMGFEVRFEKASVTFDRQGFKIITADGAVTPEYEKKSAYKSEIEDLLRRIETGANDTVNPPESSAASIKIALAEIESARTGTCVALK